MVDWDDKTKLTEESEAQAASAAQRDRAYLIVLAGNNVGEMYKVTGEQMIIGRGQNAGRAPVALNEEHRPAGGLRSHHPRVGPLGAHPSIAPHADHHAPQPGPHAQRPLAAGRSDRKLFPGP